MAVRRRVRGGKGWWSSDTISPIVGLAASRWLKPVGCWRRAPVFRTFGRPSGGAEAPAVAPERQFLPASGLRSRRVLSRRGNGAGRRTEVWLGVPLVWDVSHDEGGVVLDGADRETVAVGVVAGDDPLDV